MSTRRSASPLLVALTAAGAVAGCGGGDSSTNPDPGRRSFTVVVSPASVSLSSLGETRQMTVAVTDDAGGTVSSLGVSWSAPDPSVAVVSAGGLVMAEGNGTGRVIATFQGFADTAEVVVQQLPDSVRVTPDSLVLPGPGAVDTVNAAVTDALGSALDGASVSWATSDSTVVTVDADGVIEGRMGGTAVLTASAGALATAVPVRVVPPPSVASTALRAGVINVGYRGTLEVDGGQPPYSWTLSTGALPPGLALEAGTGLISGIPTELGSWAFTVGVTDARAQEASGEVSIEVGTTSVAPLVGDVEPAVLVEGETAAINGAGFDPDPAGNALTVGGRAAQVLTASATRITFTVPPADCLPVRSEALALVTAEGADELDVPVRPSGLMELEVGEAAWSQGCVHLPEAAAGARYMVGIMSGSEVPSSVTGATLQGLAAPEPAAPAQDPAASLLRPIRTTPVAAPVAVQRRVTASAEIPEALLLHTRAEAEVRASEREILARLGPESVARPGVGLSAAPAASPVTGDTLTLKVPIRSSNNLCTNFSSVRTVVRHAGDALIFAEDLANPVVNAFTPAQLVAFDSLYARSIATTLDSYFGTMSDLDQNGRLIVLITKEVNESGGILGFVWSGDFFDPASCPASDQGELFYGLAPDPAGVFGTARTVDDVLRIYPGLIAHEATHVVQLGRIVMGGARSKTSWEIEGGATLTEQVVGFLERGHVPGSNLGWTDIQAADPPGWFRDWWADGAYYFGYSSSGKVGGAPELCSWAGRESEGNTGPCSNGRAPYGVPSNFLRMLMDRYGPTYPGGEAALINALTGSGERGMSNVATVVGEDFRRVVAYFSIALWADGVVGDWITSWDVADVYQSLVPDARLQPYTNTDAVPRIPASVRALSTQYVDWTPAGGHPPMALKLGDGADGPAPEPMFFWILRVN